MRISSHRRSSDDFLYEDIPMVLENERTTRSLNRKEAAQFLNISVPELDRKVNPKDGDGRPLQPLIAHIRYGRRVLFTLEDLIAFRDRYRVSPAASLE